MTARVRAIGILNTPLDGGRAQFAYALIAIYLAGAHLRLSLYTGGGSTLVPNYLMLLAGALLAVVQAGQLIRRTGQILLVLAIFIIAHPYVTWAPLSSDGFDTMLSGLQLFAAIVAALAVLYTTSRLDAQGLRKFFFGAWAALMFVALLENFGLRALMQSVQAALYAGSSRGIYTSDYRDIGLYGQVRASALASEPSFLADSWASLAILVFLLDKNRGTGSSWIRLMVMFGVGYFLAPSTKVFFYLLAVLVWHYWPRSRKAFVGLLATLVPLGWLFYLLMSAEANNALGRFGSVDTGSFFARITVGPYIGAEALREFPIFGFGIGNHEGLTSLMQDVWQSTGGFSKFPHYRMADSQALMTNGFWWQWVFLGVLGGLILTYLVVRLLLALEVEHPVRVIVCTWIVWYAGFSFVGPVSWWILAMFAIPEVARRVSHDAGQYSRAGQPPLEPVPLT